MFGKFETIAPQEKPLEKITESDISREMPGVGETEIIMQRHEKYIRDLGDEKSGSLYAENAEKSRRQTIEVLKNKLDGIPKEEWKNVDVLVIASNTKYGQGMRSFETAAQVTMGISDVFDAYGIDKKQIINSRSNISQKNEGIIPTKNTEIQEPRFLNDSPEFAEYLRREYGNQTQEFWQAFEEDWKRDERIGLGAEGPEEMANRYNKFINMLRKFSAQYHKKNEGRRLIIWPVSHYDTISPYIKNEIVKTDPKQYLPVDFGAGVSLKVDREGRVSSKIQGEEFIID